MGDRRFTASGLPPGLSINPSTGEISGLVRVLGEHPVVIEARREHLTCPVAFMRFLLIVHPHDFFHHAPSAELIVNGSAETIAVSKGEVAGTASLEVLNAHQGSLDIDVISLPPGWDLDRETFEITGVVNSSGIYPLIIELRNTEHTLRVVKNVYVGDRSAGFIQHNGAGEFAVGEDVELTYTTQEANSPVTFFAEGLPEGLQLDETTGIVSGPTQQFGLHHYLIGFKDADGNLGQTYQSHYRVVGKFWPDPPQRSTQFRDYAEPLDTTFQLSFGDNKFQFLSLPE